MNLFINAGHYEGEKEESYWTIKVRDELKKLLPNAFYVPDDLDLPQTIQWINSLAKEDDFALDIHFDAHNDPRVRGVSGYYDDNSLQAEILATEISKSIKLPNKGAIHDSLSGPGSLGFVRQIKCNSVIVECGYLTNQQDRIIITESQGAYFIAQGIKNGLDRIFSNEEKKTLIKKLQEKLISLYQQLIEILKQKLVL